MLEIPESYTLAKQLNDTIQGKVIRTVKANQSPHKFTWYAGNPDDYPKLMEGKTIATTYPRAGIVEINMEDASNPSAPLVKLALSDGANIRYKTDFHNAPAKNQLYLEFEDDSSLTVSVQMYGGISAFLEGTYDNEYYLGACNKCSPLSNQFTYEYFRSLYTDKLAKASVKAFLATEQRIPGLGNGVLQDILYHAKMHPKKKMGTFTEDDFHMLFNQIRFVLKEMTEQGGRDTEKDLFGAPGKYQTYLSKKTYDNPCPKCGYLIHKEAYLGGTVYYCEHCQTL
ncbi:MAG: endonuclease VIII [Clostridiales bacterium]|nr:endonuclease VIII [Clostridiales bacterium]